MVWIIHQNYHTSFSKLEKEKLLKKEGMEKATGQYIECLIYHRMWISERCWKTPAEVRAGVRALEFKKDKEEALKDNVRIRWLGMGWVEKAETSWSENGVKKNNPKSREAPDEYNQGHQK